MTLSLTGRVVLITGGAKRVGAAICRRLHGVGANLMIHYRSSAAEAQALQSELESHRPGSCALVRADLLDTAALPRLVGETVGRFGRLDVLINNAGAGQTGPLADVPIATVRRLFDVNVFGTLAVTQAVLPRLIEKGAGRIIIVSSIAGVMAGPAFGPYSMTKHALEAMGKTLRAELAGQGIDVTLLNPGPYDTGFNDRMADSMWDWFGEASLNAPATPLFQMMRDFVTTGQRDPAEVVTRMVELTEADVTTENNFVPADIAP